MSVLVDGGIAAAPARTPTAVDALRELCVRLHADLVDPNLRDVVAATARQLDRPLQLAVAGATSAGKSTLVNALLGRRVAAVDAGECTRVVTWYEYGEDDGRVELEDDRGRREVTRLGSDGRLPPIMSDRVGHVERARVQLRDPRLRAVTIIDTPGVNTVTGRHEALTRRTLFGDAEAEHAQALLYVLRHVQQFDADTLNEFRTLSSACGITAADTVAVMTQVDRRSDDLDPWPTARTLAQRGASELRGLAFDVVPVIGLVAETAQARLLDPTDLAGLRHLAVCDPPAVEEELDDLAAFAEDPDTGLGLPVEVRRRLVERLHRCGIHAALDTLRREPGVDLAQLHDRLTAFSGYGGVGGPAPSEGVQAHLDRFRRIATQLKAHSALNRLRRLSERPTRGADGVVLAEFRRLVDTSRPVIAALSEMRLLTAIEALGRGDFSLGDEATEELHCLARHEHPSERLGLPRDAPRDAVAEKLNQALRRWRIEMVRRDRSRSGARMRDVLSAVEDIADELDRRPTPDLTTPGSPSNDREPDAGNLDTEKPPGAPDLPAPDLPAPDLPAPNLPAPDPALLDRLAAVPVLAPTQRAAVTALTAGVDVCTALAVSPGGHDRAALADAVHDQVRHYRRLRHRILPGAQLSALDDACAYFESLISQLRPDHAGPS